MPKKHAVLHFLLVGSVGGRFPLPIYLKDILKLQLPFLWKRVTKPLVLMN